MTEDSVITFADERLVG